MIINLLGLGINFGVNNLSGVLDDLLDFTFGGQSSEGLLSKIRSDLHSLGSNGGGNNFVAWDLLVELIEGGLVEKGQVDKLVRTLPLLHFFFLPLELLIAALALASLDFWILGGIT